MRSLVVALVAALFVLSLAGCSGSSDDSGTTAPATTNPPASTANAADTEAPYLADRSVNDNDIAPAAFPSFTATVTPAAIQERLDSGRAMVIFFYDSAQNVTTDERAEVEAVANDYRGLVDLITYDVGASDSAIAQANVMYASELGINSTPYIVVVDQGGFITFRWKGYLERETLGREVERVTK